MTETLPPSIPSQISFGVQMPTNVAGTGQIGADSNQGVTVLPNIVDVGPVGIPTPEMGKPA